MHQIKYLLTILDTFTSILWGFTVLDILPKIVNGSLILSNTETVMKLLFSMLGFVYTFFRIYFYVRKCKQDERLMEQVVLQKERENEHDEEIIRLLIEEKKRRNFLIGNEFLKEKKNED